ncbi:hypothetical protein LEP1GSC008_3145 [Leptospira kirschneri serovar Bulgarica str. Nikolaevo]|uniref:Uncharacterized protein n=1 Tax=Leptospira kirschneri serovar Bulgarica str. Nikolaevo TaxID=1240687 RepID=M6FQJ5_9LEPT|nr:hypothetical protein LEP1GSC008_3145 [Leptospira kirschneri serovar Bulgarica str. Nikolaevo]
MSSYNRVVENFVVQLTKPIQLTVGLSPKKRTGLYNNSIVEFVRKIVFLR